MKSGNLNFLEPSGPLQAGNGADCFTFLLVLGVAAVVVLVSTRQQLLIASHHNELPTNFMFK
jgi:hypothetical protein